MFKRGTEWDGIGLDGPLNIAVLSLTISNVVKCPISTLFIRHLVTFYEGSLLSQGHQLVPFCLAQRPFERHPFSLANDAFDRKAMPLGYFSGSQHLI